MGIIEVNDTDLCETCDKLMDMLYKDNPEEKEYALKAFREVANDEIKL